MINIFNNEQQFIEYMNTNSWKQIVWAKKKNEFHVDCTAAAESVYNT